jgi:hypothetical protein
MKKMEETIKDIERDLLINILISLRHKKMTKKEAKMLSGEFLSIFPVTDFESLFSSLKSLSNSYTEARKVYIKHAGKYINARDEEKLQKIRFFMVANNFEKAIQAGKEVN